MAKDTGVIHKEGNITTSERFLRAITAIVMLAYPMVIETSPLDFLALLPLIAIYPMFTAIVGWDPIQFARDVGEFDNNIQAIKGQKFCIISCSKNIMIPGKDHAFGIFMNIGYAKNCNIIIPVIFFHEH